MQKFRHSLMRMYWKSRVLGFCISSMPILHIWWEIFPTFITYFRLRVSCLCLLQEIYLSHWCKSSLPVKFSIFSVKDQAFRYVGHEMNSSFRRVLLLTFRFHFLSQSCPLYLLLVHLQIPSLHLICRKTPRQRWWSPIKLVSSILFYTSCKSSFPSFTCLFSVPDLTCICVF